MKKLFLIVLLNIVILSCGPSRSVSYTYKPFSEEGCGVRYSLTLNDGSYQIAVVIESDNLVFSDNPEMLLKLFDGSIVSLRGEKFTTSEKQGGIVINNVIVPVTSHNAMAMFPIREDDIIQLNKGVCKVRISTFPFKHERTFTYDVIGEALYRLYLQLPKEDSF